MADALRVAHRLVVNRRAYGEISAAIDAAAALPEASRAEVAERIALERLAVVRHYPIDLVSDEEVEEVLRRTETARASMPPRERARWLRAMCQDRPALALRHLVASTDDPGAHEDAAARGEPLEPSVDELDAGDPAWQPPAEFTEGIRYAFALPWPRPRKSYVTAKTQSRGSRSTARGAASSAHVLHDRPPLRAAHGRHVR